MCIQSDTWFLGRTQGHTHRHLDWFSCFCRAYDCERQTDWQTNRFANALIAITRTWSKQSSQVTCFVNYCSKVDVKLNLRHEIVVTCRFIVNDFFLNIHWSGRRCGMPLKWNDIAVLSMRLTRHAAMRFTRHVIFCIDGRVYTNLKAWERLTSDCLVWQITSQHVEFILVHTAV